MITESFGSMEQYETGETFTYYVTSLFASQRCAYQTSNLRDLGNLGLGEHTITVYMSETYRENPR